MRKILLGFAMLAIASGCAGSKEMRVDPVTDVPTLETLMKQNAAVYLASETEVQERIDDFFKRIPEPNEHHKINYLISALRQSEHVFIRNGESYTGSQASRWFRWKLGHKRFKESPIKSAADFIKRVSTKSNTSGKYYQVKVDGMYHKLYKLLESELQALEDRHVQNILSQVVSQEAFSEITSDSSEMSTSVIVPPVAPAP